MLQGELTMRFILKCLTVFVLAGAVFLYYNRGLSSTSGARLWNRGFAFVAAAAILVSLGFGFFKAGTPAERRARAEDRRRVTDLAQIATTMNTRWNTRKPAFHPELPANLEELSRGTGGRLNLIDPFTGKPYEYKPVQGSNYQLCAVFSAATPKRAGDAEFAWSHPSGPYCYDLDASKAPAQPDF